MRDNTGSILLLLLVGLALFAAAVLGMLTGPGRRASERIQ